MPIDRSDYHGFKSIVHEALIDGNKVHYDAIGSGTLEDARNYYEPQYSYIGTTNQIFLNGVLQKEHPYHVFVLKMHKSPSSEDLNMMLGSNL